MNDILNIKVYATCDESVKNSTMGIYWVIMNTNKEVLIEKEMFSKNWTFNTPRSAEVTVLLDLVKTIYSKSYNIISRNIPITFDNIKVVRIVNGGLITSNHHNQDSTAEAKTIQNIINKVIINIIPKRILRNQKIQRSFE